MEKKPVVLVLDPTVVEPYEKYRDVLEVRFAEKERNLSEDEIVEAVKDVTALVVTSRYAITRRIIENAPELKLIAKCGAVPSPVMIDRQAAAEHGVHITFTPGSTSLCVAEHTVMLILCLIKQTFPIMRQFQQGHWRGDIEMVSELSDKTVGIVGLGQIGRQTVKRLDPFGCKMYFYDPFVKDFDGNAEKATLDFLFENSDVLVLHCGVTEETIHMVNEERLHSMKPTAYLVNTSRGALVDEPALIKALENHWIAGAALDVYAEEPPAKDNPLLTMPQVVVTPHTASWTKGALTRSAEGSLDNLFRILKGEAPLYSVNADMMK